MDDVRVWLVERTYSDRDLLSLVYATPDGEWYLRKERAGRLGGETTAAIEVERERLAPVTDESEKERYATEATRIAEKRDANDIV